MKPILLTENEFVYLKEVWLWAIQYRQASGLTIDNITKKLTPPKMETKNEKSIYWKLISDFMLKLDSDIIAVGEDRAKIKRELLYWVNTI